MAPITSSPRSTRSQGKRHDSHVTSPAQDQEQDGDSDSSGLSDPPSDLESPSPLISKKKQGKRPISQALPQQQPPSSSSPPPPAEAPPQIPAGYKINSITGDLMVDPKSRDSVANFRKLYHPGVDFSSGRFIDESAYAVPLRHVPPNVSKAKSPWVAPLGPATAGDEERYREPPKRAEGEDDMEQEAEFLFVKRERVGRAVREYMFLEDEGWREQMGEAGKGVDQGDESARVEDDEEEGDTTIEDPAMQESPPGEGSYERVDEESASR